MIRRINGFELNSTEKALELYQKLRDSSRIELELDRRGEAKTILNQLGREHPGTAEAQSAQQLLSGL